MDPTNKNEDIFIIKINLDDLNNLNNIGPMISPNDELVYMNKKDYTKFILNMSGTPITKFKCDYNCSICHEPQKYSHKLFKLNECNHIFHSKCIKKWFKTLSNNFKSIHNCPLCRKSVETIIDL